MRKLREIFLKAALIAAAVITGGILLFLIGIILKRGLPQLSWSFLTTATSYLAGTTGILPNVCNTLYLILIAMGAALPLGVGAAVYITEYAENPRVVRLISFAAETLTGIPSILFGLIGMLFFIKLGALRQGVLAGGLTLALMVLPTVMANTRESLLAVPRAYREGALALGSGKWHMVRTVVLPNAVDGIVTGCILSVGRITGESAALLFTAGFGLRLLGFKAALESSSASLSVALYLYASEQGKFDIAFGIAAVLQLALSMDYSIILMNRYRQELKKTDDRKEAMANALRAAFGSITGSAVTTIVGLLVLVFMSFKIGADIGIVLAKGVAFSMLCVFTVLPALILLSHKLIEKTEKKERAKKARKNGLSAVLGGFSYRFRSVIAILFVAVYRHGLSAIRYKNRLHAVRKGYDCRYFSQGQHVCSAL